MLLSRESLMTANHKLLRGFYMLEMTWPWLRKLSTFERGSWPRFYSRSPQINLSSLVI